MAGRIVVVGGGAAAAWLVLALLRRGVDGIDVVEPRAEVGRGLAYSTRFPGHLLNVPVDKMDMDAEPGDPLFATWLPRVAPELPPDGYAPRSLYGDFLAQSFRSATAGRDVRHLRAAVSAIRRTASGFAVTAGGETVPARAVVLALGNLPPRRLSAVADERIVEDPWAAPATAGGQGQRVLIAGTGLTALDVVLAVEAATPGATYTLCAGRPFLPPADRAAAAWEGGKGLIGKSPVAAWRTVHEALRVALPDGWYGVIDGARPHVEAIWTGWTLARRRSFWRHGARHWLHHRHRAAPETMAGIEALQRAGRFRLAPGRVGAITTEADALEVRVGNATLQADRVVNATGPSLSPASHPLLAAMVRDGLVAPDPVGLGLAVSPSSQALDQGGAPVAGLHVLGALTRGQFLEIVAVPHIRRKANVVAEAIAGCPQA